MEMEVALSCYASATRSKSVFMSWEGWQQVPKQVAISCGPDFRGLGTDLEGYERRLDFSRTNQ